MLLLFIIIFSLKIVKICFSHFNWDSWGAFSNREIISHNRSNLYSGINLPQFLPVIWLLSFIKFLIEKIILDLLSVFVNIIRFNTRYVASVLCNTRYVASVLCNSLCLTSATEYTCHIWLHFIIINRSGDVEGNPGPQYNSCQSFSILYWNPNSIFAHNFIKLSLFCACLSETFWIVVFCQMMLI